AGFVARTPGVPTPSPIPGLRASDSGSAAHEAAEDVVAALERGVENAEIHGLVPHDPLAESAPIQTDDSIEVDFDEEDLEPIDISPRRGTPVPEPARAVEPKAPAGRWPDLSD